MQLATDFGNGKGNGTEVAYDTFTLIQLHKVFFCHQHKLSPKSVINVDLVLVNKFYLIMMLTVVNESMIRFDFWSCNRQNTCILKCYSMLNHKNLSFKATMGSPSRSQQGSLSNIPPREEIQGVIFDEVYNEYVQDFQKTCLSLVNFSIS